MFAAGYLWIAAFLVAFVAPVAAMVTFFFGVIVLLALAFVADLVTGLLADMALVM